MDNPLGKFFIKYTDKWRGDYFLTEDLFFNTDIEKAAVFRFLKSGNGKTSNGDIVRIGLSNDKVLSLSDDVVILTSINNKNKKQDTFLITNGSSDISNIEYNEPVMFLSNKSGKSGLRFDWSLKAQSDPLSFLRNSTYNDENIKFFEFYLERPDRPITQSKILKHTIEKSKELDLPKTFLSDTYKIFVIILFALIIIVAFT